MAKRSKKKTREQKKAENKFLTCKFERTSKSLIEALNKITTEELINDVSRKLS